MISAYIAWGLLFAGLMMNRRAGTYSRAAELALERPHNDVSPGGVTNEEVAESLSQSAFRWAYASLSFNCAAIGLFTGQLLWPALS